MQIILGKPGISASFPVSPNTVLNKTMRLYFTGSMSFAYSSKNKDEKERWKHPSLVIYIQTCTDIRRLLSQFLQLFQRHLDGKLSSFLPSFLPSSAFLLPSISRGTQSSLGGEQIQSFFRVHQGWPPCHTGYVAGGKVLNNQSSKVKRPGWEVPLWRSGNKSD